MTYTKLIAINLGDALEKVYFECRCLGMWIFSLTPVFETKKIPVFLFSFIICFDILNFNLKNEISIILKIKIPVYRY